MLINFRFWYYLYFFPRKRSFLINSQKKKILNNDSRAYSVHLRHKCRYGGRLTWRELDRRALELSLHLFLRGIDSGFYLVFLPILILISQFYHPLITESASLRLLVVFLNPNSQVYHGSPWSALLLRLLWHFQHVLQCFPPRLVTFHLSGRSEKDQTLRISACQGLAQPRSSVTWLVSDGQKQNARGDEQHSSAGEILDEKQSVGRTVFVLHQKGAGCVLWKISWTCLADNCV